MAVGFDHQNVQIHNEDGAEFLTKHDSYFDVIITDSSDPIGKTQFTGRFLGKLPAEISCSTLYC